MSQVRKLLQGNKILKAQEGYKFQLDSQDIYLTDDDLKEIDNKIAALPMERKMFLGNATTAIKSGQEGGRRANNTVTRNLISGINDRNMKRLEKQEPDFWESFLPTDSYYAKQAINDLLTIINSVANKSKSEAPTIEKQKIGTETIPIDFNTDSNGKIYVSPYAYGPKTRTEQILQHLEKGEESSYDPNGWDFSKINMWIDSLPIENGKTKYQVARETLGKYWDKLGVHGFNEAEDYNGDDLADLFELFGIGFNPQATTKKDEGVRAANDPENLLDENGNVNTDARTSTGSFVIYRGLADKGQDPNGYYINATRDQLDSYTHPYLITERDWDVLGLNTPELEKYKHGIIYNGRLLTQDELNTLTGLPAYGIMETARTINNNADLSGSQKNDELKNILNWFNKDSEYGFTDFTSNLASFANPSWSSRFNNENNNLAFFDATEAFGYRPNGGKARIIGVYDYNDPQNEHWGFRQPSFFIVDENGNIIEDSIDNLGLKYNPFVDINKFDTNKYLKAKETIVDATYGEQTYDIEGTAYNVDTRKSVNIYHRRVLENNVYVDKYYVRNGNKLVEISDKLKNKIDSDPQRRITQKEINRGKTKVGFLQWEKDGGKINYIAKLQQGKTVNKAAELNAPKSEDFSTNSTDPIYPIDDEGMHFDRLPLAEQFEIVGVLGDLVGTGLGFTGEYGDIAASAIGLGSDLGAYLPADIMQKRPWYSVVGNTLLNVGMDAVGLIPWLGDSVRMAKLSRAISKAKGLKKFLPVLSTTMNGLGFGYAVGPTMKLFNEGPKSLSTDDWVAVARGLQATLNATRTRVKRRPDAALASEISKIKGQEAMPSRHGATTKLPDDVKIKFNEAEINEIRTAENPAQILREKALAQGADPNHLPVEDADLLARFGFTVEKGADGKITKVGSPEGYTLETHSQTVRSKDAGKDVPITLTNKQVSDVLEGSGSDAAKRLRKVLTDEWHVDPTKIEADDVKLLRQYGFGVTPGFRGPHVFREQGWDNVSERLNSSDKYSKIGWLTDRFGSAQKRQDFVDKAMKDDLIRPKIDEAVLSEDASTALRRGYARAVARQNEELGAQMVSNSGRYLFDPEKHSDLLGRKETPNPAEAARATSEKTPVETRTPEPPVSRTNETTPESAIESTKKKVYSTPISKDRSIEIAAKREALAKQRKVASNLEKLRKSNDPMLTLKELSEEDAKDMFTISESKLIDAIEESIQNMVDRGKFKNQNEVSYYRNNIYNLFKGFYKKGGIIKAQFGRKLGLLQEDTAMPNYYDNWLYLPPYQPEVTIPSKETYQKEAEAIFKDQETGKPKLGWTLATGHSDLTPYRNVDVEQLEVEEEPIYRGVSTQTDKDENSYVGGPTKPLKDRSKYAFLGWETLGLLNKFRNQNRYRREDEARIRDARYSVQSQNMDYLPTSNPLFQHRLNQLGQNRMSGLTGIATNDWTRYNAALNQNQYQNDLQVRDVIAQQSQDQFQRETQNTTLRNQKYGFDTTAANENARLTAYFNSMMHNPKLAQIMQQDQSEDNYKQLISRMIAEDMNKLKTYNQSVFASNQARALDSYLRSTYPKETEEYNKLSWQERMQFTDLQDFIERTNPSAIDDIRIQKQQLETDAYNWLVQNGTNFNYEGLRGRRSSATDVNGPMYSKKGGTLRGSTRYTKEPDEQVWIDNNKAAHQAVAKLNDATLKMLLSALK